jgi:hypothetical protein
MTSNKLIALFTALSLSAAGPAVAQSSAQSLSPAVAQDARAGADLGAASALGGGAGIHPLEIAAIIGAAIFLYFYLEADDEDEPESP